MASRAGVLAQEQADCGAMVVGHLLFRCIVGLFWFGILSLESK